MAVVCGNPKPKSRTLAASLVVAEKLCGAPPELVLNLVEMGPGLLTWGDPRVSWTIVEADR